MRPPKNPVEAYFDRITPYHYYAFFFIFTTKPPIFWHILNFLFLTPPMDFNCKSGTGNTTNQCPCDDVEWDRSVFEETAQSKYGMYCERDWQISFSQSVLFAGTLIGAFGFGYLSDKYGRQKAFGSSLLLIAIAGVLVVYMPNATSFIFMRCIEGIGIGGSIVTAYVLCVEYCGVSYRETVTALLHIPVNLGHVTLAGISYALRHCDTLQLALSIPMFLCALIYVLVHESPKWLVDNNQIEKATIVLTKIAKFNKKPYDHIKGELEAYAAANAAQHNEKVSFTQIFKHKRLMINLVCMSVIYFTCGMGYYGVSQYIGMMSGNVHSNVAISGGLLIPGTTVCVFLLKKFGRRSFLMVTSFASGILMLVVMLIPEHMGMVRVSVACLCNTFFFMSFIIVFLYGVELFPTCIRNSVLGFLSVVSRTGQIIAPFINVLPGYVSGSVFGGMAIVGGILCIPLPETKNIELPATLEDSKNLGKKK